MKLKKILTLMCCAVLLVCISVGATVAYLTSTDKVQNTFTVGALQITLDEADVNTDGTYVTDVNSRTDANEYHLVPGHEYIKDPIVYFANNNDKSWVFVKVENGIVNIESKADGYKNIAAQIEDNGWKELSAGVYYKTVEANTSGAAVKLPVFEKFAIATDADVSNYATKTNANAKIDVTAYAIQYDGFSTAELAWAEVSKLDTNN